MAVGEMKKELLSKLVYWRRGCYRPVAGTTAAQTDSSEHLEKEKFGAEELGTC